MKVNGKHSKTILAVLVALFFLLFASSVFALTGAQELRQLVDEGKVYVSMKIRPGTEKLVGPSFDVGVVYKQGVRGLKTKLFALTKKPIYIGPGGGPGGKAMISSRQETPHFTRFKSEHILGSWKPKTETPKKKARKLRSLNETKKKVTARKNAVDAIKAERTVTEVRPDGTKVITKEKVSYTPKGAKGGNTVIVQGEKNQVVGGDKITTTFGKGGRSGGGGGGGGEVTPPKPPPKPEPGPVPEPVPKPTPEPVPKPTPSKFGRVIRGLGKIALIGWVADEVYFYIDTKDMADIYRAALKGAPTLDFNPDLQTFSKLNTEAALLKLNSKSLPEDMREGIINTNASKNIWIATKFYEDYFDKSNWFKKHIMTNVSFIASQYRQLIAEMKAATSINNLVEGTSVELWELDKESNEWKLIEHNMNCVKAFSGGNLSVSCNLSEIDSLPAGEYRLGLFIELNPAVYNWVKEETNGLLQQNRCNFYQGGGNIDYCSFYETIFPLNELLSRIDEEKSKVLSNHPSTSYVNEMGAALKDAAKDWWENFKIFSQYANFTQGKGAYPILYDMPKKEDYPNKDEYNKALDEYFEKMKKKSTWSLAWEHIKRQVLSGAGVFFGPVDMIARPLASNFRTYEVRANLAEKWNDFKNYPLTLRAALNGLPVFYDFKSDGTTISLSEQEDDFASLVVEPYFNGESITDSTVLNILKDSITTYVVDISKVSNPSSLTSINGVSGLVELEKEGKLVSSPGDLVSVVGNEAIIIKFDITPLGKSQEYYQTFSVLGLKKHGEAFEDYIGEYIYDNGESFVLVSKDAQGKGKTEPDCIRIDFKSGETSKCGEEKRVSLIIEPFFDGQKIRDDSVLTEIKNNLGLYRATADDPDSLLPIQGITGWQKAHKEGKLASHIDRDNPVKVNGNKDIEIPFASDYSLPSAGKTFYYSFLIALGAWDNKPDGYITDYIYNNGNSFIKVSRTSDGKEAVDPSRIKIDFKTGKTTILEGTGAVTPPQPTGIKNLQIGKIEDIETGEMFSCKPDDPLQYRVCFPAKKTFPRDIKIPVIQAKVGEKIYVGFTVKKDDGTVTKDSKPSLDTRDNADFEKFEASEFTFGEIENGKQFYVIPSQETYSFTVKGWSGKTFEVYACQNKEPNGVKCDYVIEKGKHVERTTWVEPNYEAASLTIQREKGAVITPAATKCDECSSVPECLACLDWKFITDLFGGKHVMVSSSGERNEMNDMEMGSMDDCVGETKTGVPECPKDGMEGMHVMSSDGGKKSLMPDMEMGSMESCEMNTETKETECPELAAPANLTAMVMGEGVHLKWSAVEGADHYEVAGCPMGGMGDPGTGCFGIVDDSVSSTELMTDGGAGYGFAVRAVDSEGNESEWSETVEVTG